MARSLSKTEIEMEWQALPKNWYAIYQWERTKGAGYLEWIAEWIIAAFPQIQLLTDGLRSRAFRVEDHRGQIRLDSEIKQLTEKRLVRAMYNLGRLPVLGSVIDYEVPLKDTDDAAHGDIDLLCVSSGTCFCVEAKQPNAGESILKAILQAYAYTSLVSCKQQMFLSNFKLDSTLQFTPAVLTFASAQSGRQLKEIGKYPCLLNLIENLNAKLEIDGINPMRFFVVENPNHELASCLTTTTETNDDVKAVFRQGFALSIMEQPLPSSRKCDRPLSCPNIFQQD